MKYLCTFMLFICCFSLSAQVSINSDGSSADPSSILDVKSTTGGMMVPSMTEAQRIAIVSPAEALIVYQTNTGSSGNGFYLFKGGIWTSFKGGHYYTGSVSIGDPDIILSSPGLTAVDPTGSNVDGDVQINFPALGASGNLPTVLITPEYDKLNVDLPYCEANFLGSCLSKDHYIYFRLFNITSGNTHIQHTPAPPECLGVANNYRYLDQPSGMVPPDPGSIYTADSLCAGVDQFLLSIQGQAAASTCTSYDFFIDWNQDGDFDDSGELVQQKLWGCDVSPFTNAPPGTPVNMGPFPVPATAATGKTRIRVTTRQLTTTPGVDPSDQPCNNDNTDGSAKDYDIFIKNGTTPSGVSSHKVCNVLSQTLTSVRVLCYDISSNADNIKFRFKIIEN